MFWQLHLVNVSICGRQTLATFDTCSNFVMMMTLSPVYLGYVIRRIKITLLLGRIIMPSNFGMPRRNVDCGLWMGIVHEWGRYLGISTGCPLVDVTRKLFSTMFVVGIILYRHMWDILKKC